MSEQGLTNEGQQALAKVLGYLNFSSGKFDPQLFIGLNELFRSADPESSRPAWQQVVKWLQQEKAELAQSSAAFADSAQATAVIDQLAEHVLPQYWSFHRDLLFSQPQNTIFNSFFVGRVLETILRRGPDWEDTEQVCQSCIAELSDYVGHRPVAVLESRKIEPYPHEWIRPVPLYIRDVGCSAGRYQAVLELAIEMLRELDRDIAQTAHFDIELLDEMAFDPRAYDFDHPVNKRPNYHFGQWDPHHIDNQGRYRRYVIQQVTLEALCQRIDEGHDLPREELLEEAAAVLAGTVLMGCGICGTGPDTYDSSVNIANLLPTIADYRDLFYQRLLMKMEGEHAERLHNESRIRRQPFGGARQHLNAALGRCRAERLESTQLARVFALMGHDRAAKRRVAKVAIPSARLVCEMVCDFAVIDDHLRNGQLAEAALIPPRIVETMKRAIQCGALIDPWNLLGFDAQFSLFAARENSVHDHRADELVDLAKRIFDSYARLWSEAASVNDQAVAEQVATGFDEFVTWWRQYAAHEVSSVEATDPLHEFQAAERVAEVLRTWHQGGASAGDIKFWAPFADNFESPQAYVLTIDTLLRRDDLVAAMGLLIHWLSRAAWVSLQPNDVTFADLAERWLLALFDQPEDSDRFALLSKFVDYIEANADEYWRVPSFEAEQSGGARRTSSRREQDDIDELFEGPDVQDDDEEDDLYSAAYENVVYRDSTDDGVDGAIFDDQYSLSDDLSGEWAAVTARLAFLSGLARLWQLAAVGPMFVGGGADSEETGQTALCESRLEHLLDVATENLAQLEQLVEFIHEFPLATPSGDHDSLAEYDRQRLAKDSLLEQAIITSVEMTVASIYLQAVLDKGDSTSADSSSATAEADPSQDEIQDRGSDNMANIVCLLARVVDRDKRGIVRTWDDFRASISDCCLLYVPLARGGHPHQIVAARSWQRIIRDLLNWLPKIGMLSHTFELVEAARDAERSQPVGPGGVTEFDELFKIGFRSIVETVAAASIRWQPDESETEDAGTDVTTMLVASLERLTETMLLCWLSHSRTLRLSILEQVNDDAAWQKLVHFIKQYGGDLFTQQFLNLSNVRAILHQGVDNWLRLMEKRSQFESVPKLIEDVDDGITRRQAVRQLSLVLEAIIENYAEYRDYNSMTTQSDRGDMLYSLLDFVRLMNKYDRICWKLRPVVVVHDVLVQNNHEQAAKMWRRALKERTHKEADYYQEQLALLQQEYAMNVPSVADRISERFIRPLLVDRMRALVRPAIEEARHGGSCPKFEVLEHETEVLTREPSGVGLDLPGWLVALQDEVDAIIGPLPNDEHPLDRLLQAQPLPYEQLEQQLEEFGERS